MRSRKRKADPRVVANNHQQANPQLIKLPRATVDACGQPCGRSLAFSYTKEHEGHAAIIYATNDDGSLFGAFQGVLDRVSKKGSRQFTIRDATPVNAIRWQEKFGHLAPLSTD